MVKKYFEDFFFDFCQDFSLLFFIGKFRQIPRTKIQNIFSPRKKSFFRFKFVFHKYIVFSFPTHPSRLESDQNNGYCKAGKFKTPRKSKILWFFGIDLHILLEKVKSHLLLSDLIIIKKPS